LYPATPDAIVRAFLTSLQIDPSGANSLHYIGGTLAQSITEGRPLPAALGVQNIFESFDVPEQPIGSGATSATVVPCSTSTLAQLRVRLH
jgi:hypothetical protein